MADEFDERFWEEHYRGNSGHAGHAGHAGRPGRPGPNEQLVAVAAELVPGTALDAGCGWGGDATWLADRGWRVTAVDVSATALRAAREAAESLAAEVSGRIEWRQADLTSWTPPAARFDLVSSHYVHVPAGSREPFLRGLAAAVAPGGTLLVVGHDAADPARSHGPSEEAYLSADRVVALLDPDAWDVLVAESRTGRAGHDAQPTVLHDVVVRARRRPSR